VAERTTHVYSTDTTTADEQRVTHAFSTASANGVKLLVSHVYATFTTVKGAVPLVCPAIAAPIATILTERLQRFHEIICPGIANPIADITFTRPYSNIICPAIAKPIPFCEYLYRPRPPIFTGGAGITTAVLPRRQTVSTRALRRRRRRISRRR
jgi:hypothetical protein